jgi:hypothetical protein
MAPPDLPPRTAPRAPLTDVVPKRTLMIIAVVVALAVLGTVLALTLGGDDKGAKGGRGGGAAKGVASASSSADTKKDDDSSARTDSDGSASATTGSTPGTGSSASAGSSNSSGSRGAPVVSTHKGRQGYSIGLPKGWKYQSTGAAGDRFTGPQGQKLLVAWTTTPKDDPVADWRNQERYMVRSQYRKIRIESVDYRGWNTADWEFTYVDGGTKYRSIDRGFVVNSHAGYALMYTAEAAHWDDELRRDTWRTLTKSFEPKA